MMPIAMIHGAVPVLDPLLIVIVSLGQAACGHKHIIQTVHVDMETGYKRMYMWPWTWKQDTNRHVDIHGNRIQTHVDMETGYKCRHMRMWTSMEIGMWTWKQDTNQHVDMETR